MILNNLYNDLVSNPLFISFSIIELIIFISAFYYLLIIYKRTNDVLGLGSRIKEFFESTKEQNDDHKEEYLKNLNESNDVTKRIFKIITSSEQDELGIDLRLVEKILKYEFEKPISFIRTMINILPVVGLIGTFVGISIAVYHLSFSSNISQIQETIVNNLRSLNPFLDGIKLAFYTTILALLFALTLRVTSEILSNRSKNAIIIFIDYFTIELNEYIKPSGPAEKIAKSVSGFSKRVSKLSSNIEDSLNKIVANYSRNSESQARQFDANINRLKSIEVDIIKNLDTLWDKISLTYSSTAEQINKATDNISGITEKSLTNSEKMSTIIGEFQEISKSQIDNTTEIGLAVRKLTEDSQKIIVDISKFIKPLEELRLKYDQVLNKAIELNEPFKETNTELKEKFIELIKSINDLQSLNGVQFEKLNVYANSLESNLGVKLDSIAESEIKTQTMMNFLTDVQSNLDKSITSLKLYSMNLADASQILVNNVETQLHALFIDIKSRQNIAININEDRNDTSKKIEFLVSKQNEVFQVYFKELNKLNATMDLISAGLVKPPLFSLKRWFGNGNHKPKKGQIEELGPSRKVNKV